MTDEVEITLHLPLPDMDALGLVLCDITKALHERDPESVAHGFLGGSFGYGGNWSSPVFDMRPYCWDDCDCGFEDRSETWHAAHPHRDDCFQVVLRSRFAKYDEESGYNAAEKLINAPGSHISRSTSESGMVMQWTEQTASGKSAHRAWCKAHDAQTKAHDKLTRALYLERKLKPVPYQWHCTCGVDSEAKKYFTTEGHYPTCCLTLPNFRHHASGFEVRWYKYIGRSMEVVGTPPDLRAMAAECIADVKQAAE